MAGTLANRCDELLEHYDKAIAWYEAIIEDEETPYNDSIFATIDLGNLYLKMEACGAKGARGKLAQFVPKSADAFAKQTDEALRKLRHTPRRLNQARELPEQYWTDLVTEQPAGYVVDENGDVHLHSAEALAWLISVVNGLNGQEADDFNGKKVTLEANVDMATALWVPIADGTNLGDPNPDKLKFCGTIDGNGFVVNNLILFHNPNYENFESFFGNLCGARIENVVLRHVYAEGRNMRDGKFFGSAEPYETDGEARPNVIDRCYVEIDEMRKNGFDSESALFGFKNDGIITNCMVKLGKLSYPGNIGDSEGLFVFANYGSIQNCASLADSLKWLHNFGGMTNDNYGTIENCYSYIGNWFGVYQTWWPPIPRLGVCVNNFGTIRNCYYNKIENLDFTDDPAYTNSGTISDTESFNKEEDGWTFTDTVRIQGQDGAFYETILLIEALNDWRLCQENGEVFYAWCADDSFWGNNLPVLCDFDITEVEEKNEEPVLVNIYPNPANGLVCISGMKVAKLQVCNMLGQTVKTCQNTNAISVSDLPEGLYLLRMTDGKGTTVTRRLVVK